MNPPVSDREFSDVKDQVGKVVTDVGVIKGDIVLLKSHRKDDRKDIDDLQEEQKSHSNKLIEYDPHIKFVEKVRSRLLWAAIGMMSLGSLETIFKLIADIIRKKLGV